MASSQTVYRYRSYVMGTVLSSVAFLEAKLAELRIDALDNHLGISAVGLTKAQRNALALVLADRGSLLERYQAGLRAVGGRPLKADQEPYKATNLLIKLRHFLVHFPAEWMATADNESGPIPQSELPLIERQLRRQFPSTGFAEPSRPFFPDHCLSAGCARWAAESSLAFSSEFSARAGIVMKHLRPRIRGQ